MITITDSALTKIQQLLLEENVPNLNLRTFVQGGGCSGFQYGFTFDQEVAQDDFEFSFDNIKVVIDSASIQYLQGSTIDFKDDLNSTGFSINNPNAETSCGCGNSFSI